MRELDRVRELAGQDSGLAVVVTQRNDGSPQTSVVNAAVVEHPVTREPVVGFVIRGETLKHRHLRQQPRASVVFRVGWEWIAVEGDVDLAGPDDRLAGVAPTTLPGLLADIYTAALGGAREDWEEFARTEGQLAVLVRPTRVYSNPD